ncbi:MAG: hypothetical protein IPL14_20355 [Nitrospira sp.]|nr:hypothetical protein [Nitrospira sp.]
MGEHVVDRQGCQEVGDQDLFGKALEDQKESIVKSLSRYVGEVVQLWEELLRPHNRACDQLREKGNKDGKLEEISFQNALPAVHVDRVTHCLKRIKGDADRQQEFVSQEGKVPPEHRDRRP